MTLSKKILAVVMSLVMLVACFAVTASAYTYVPEVTGGELKISVTADKTTVEPGDTVTFSMRINSGSISNLSSFNAVFLYNGDQLAPVGTTPQTFRTWQGDCAASFANPNAAGNMNFPVEMQLKSNLTAEELAYFTKGILILGSGTSSQTRWNPAPNEACMTFQMTVSENVKPGEEIWFGLHDSAYQLKKSTFAVDGKVQQDMSVFDLTDGMVKLTVASAHSTIVDHAKHQIRFQKNADGIYNEMFDIRYLAKIDATTFLNTFGSEAKAKDMISEIGFVFAKHNSIGGADKFDLATAKAMVEQDATAPAGYKKKTVDYLSTTVVPGTYAFSCIVKDIPDAEHDTNGLSAIGYIIYTDKNGDKYTDYYAVGVVSEPFADIYNANTSHIPR